MFLDASHPKRGTVHFSQVYRHFFRAACNHPGIRLQQTKDMNSELDSFDSVDCTPNKE